MQLYRLNIRIKEKMLRKKCKWLEQKLYNHLCAFCCGGSIQLCCILKTDSSSESWTGKIIDIFGSTLDR